MLLELSFSLVMFHLGSPQVCTGPAGSILQGDKPIISCTCSAVTGWKSDHGGQVEGTGAVTARFDSTNASPGLVTITPTCSGHVHANPVLIVVGAAPVPTVGCSANPSTVRVGDSSTITSTAMNPQNRTLTYSYSAYPAGAISGNTSTATLSTIGVAPGVITVTCNVVDDRGASASMPTTVTVVAPPPQ
jgi:hypothetical protein